MLDEAAMRVTGSPLGIPDPVIRAALDPVRFIETRMTLGSVHPDEVRKMAAEARDRLGAHRALLSAVASRIREARAQLDARVQDLMQPTQQRPGS